MPGEANAQYRRNLARAVASVASARVSVRKIVDVSPSIRSARKVQAILTSGTERPARYAGGSNDDLARRSANRMLAYLRAVAPTLATINHMILSHPHRDHVELLPDLFGAYQIAQVWIPAASTTSAAIVPSCRPSGDEPDVAYHNALQDFGTRDSPLRRT